MSLALNLRLSTGIRDYVLVIVEHSTAHNYRAIRYDRTRIRTLHKKHFSTLGSLVLTTKLDIVLDILYHQRKSGQPPPSPSPTMNKRTQRIDRKPSVEGEAPVRDPPWPQTYKLSLNMS